MQKDHLIALEGRNVVLEALKQDRNIKIIYIEDTAQGDKVEVIYKLALQNKVELQKVNSSFLNRLSKTGNHQGVIGMATRYSTYTSSQYIKYINSENITNVSVCMLRKVDFEHNLGAIIRTASTAGINAIVIPKGKKSSISETVERVSMGGLSSITIIEESFYSCLKNFKKAGFKTFALEVTGEKYYFDEDLTGNVCFIFGSESETLGEEVIKNVDSVLKIPIKSNISSLNVSVSAGIIFYERLRQQMK